jgi:isopentenyl-diphosphate delta-isomerase
MKSTSDMHRIVSSEAEELILVDADDNESGFVSKAEAHDGAGVLHRAFSLFLFDGEGRTLLQRRAAGKRLWPGYWSNSCCSHPRRGESMELATRRRLHDELNVSADIEFVYKFIYQAQFGDAGSEHELCHVYVGRIHDAVQENRHEIEALRFVTADELDAEMAASPDSFTPWFKLEWRCLCDEHSDTLAKYLR